MRNKFKSLGFIELETRKDGTKFTSKALREHANALNAHTADYSETQKSILDEVCVRPVHARSCSTCEPPSQGISAVEHERLECIGGMDEVAPAPRFLVNSPHRSMSNSECYLGEHGRS